MLTATQLAEVPLLADVPPEELDRLARGVADMRLAPGDYAVNEGEERALLIVLEGAREITRRVDGVERVLGQRTPGQLHGEVPITFGTPFLGAARAKVASRVLRSPVKRVASAVGEGSMAIAFTHQYLAQAR